MFNLYFFISHFISSSSFHSTISLTLILSSRPFSFILTFSFLFSFYSHTSPGVLLVLCYCCCCCFTMSIQRIPKCTASTLSFRLVYPAAYYTFSLRCATFFSNKIQPKQKSYLPIYFLPVPNLPQYRLLPPIL